MKVRILSKDGKELFFGSKPDAVNFIINNFSRKEAIRMIEELEEKWRKKC